MHTPSAAFSFLTYIIQRRSCLFDLCFAPTDKERDELVICALANTKVLSYAFEHALRARAPYSPLFEEPAPPRTAAAWFFAEKENDSFALCL